MNAAQNDTHRIVADVVWTGGTSPTGPSVVEVVDGTITAVEPLTGARPSGPGTVDLGAAVLMPGLVNTHAHTPMSLMRGVAEGHSLLTMEGFLAVLRTREAHLTPALVPASVQVSCADFIRHGITAFADQYFFADQIAPAVIDSGLRAALAWGIVELGDDDARAREVAAATRFAEQIQGASRIVRGWLGPHAFFVDNQPEAMVIARDVAERLGVGLHVHFSTSSEEDDYCQAHFGTSALTQLTEMGMLRVPTILAHGNTIRTDELPLLAGTPATISVVPSVAMQSGVPAAPVRAALDAGVNVALGTDNPCNNTNADLFEEMATLGKLAAFTSRRPNEVTPAEILRIATVNGHRALGGAAVDGTLVPGAVADMIAIPISEIARGPVGAQSLESALVYGTSGASVRDSMVDGRWVMRDQDVLTIDVPAALRAQQTDYDTLTARMLAAEEHRGRE
ncbi:amidohydrolase family protein [Microbacterium indicum]|uniref:amidohydrolase family protein n=1 Tax=Microbacterium indicum TaxID=358100 RepID=UPI00041A20D7|nr:amidohydrolase family protein [Microbacterium indicum]